MFVKDAKTSGRSKNVGSFEEWQRQRNRSAGDDFRAKAALHGLGLYHNRFADNPVGRLIGERYGAESKNTTRLEQFLIDTLHPVWYPHSVSKNWGFYALCFVRLSRIKGNRLPSVG